MKARSWMGFQDSSIGFYDRLIVSDGMSDPNVL